MASLRTVLAIGHVDPYFRRHHQVTIPPLQCSPPMRLHPEFERVRKEMDSWLLALTKPSTPEEAKLVVQTQFPLLTCGAYARGDPRRCSAIGKFMAWTFMLDDMTDVREWGAPLFSSLEGKLGRKMHEVGAAESDAGAAAPARYMDTMALEWWTEMNELGMSPALQRRFLSELMVSLEAQRKQAAWRKAGHMPDGRTFLETRRFASGVLVLLVLSEWFTYVEMNEEMERALIAPLRLAAVDHVNCVNDLLSLKWEYSNGELSNLTSVICNQLRRKSAAKAAAVPHNIGQAADSFQRSVDMVQRIIRKRDLDFARLLHRARSSPSLMATPGMPSYLQAVGDWMSSHLHWSYATSRYHGLDIPAPYPVHQPLTLHLSPRPFIPSVYLFSSFIDDDQSPN